jgi:hypothetical protein
MPLARRGPRGQDVALLRGGEIDHFPMGHARRTSTAMETAWHCNGFASSRVNVGPPPAIQQPIARAG